MPNCAFLNCKNYTGKTRRGSGISYHSFPSDPILKHKWTCIVQVERNEYDWKPSHFSKICSEHFQEKDTRLFCSARYLRKYALPVIAPSLTVERKITENLDDDVILNPTYVEMKQEDLEDIEASIPVPTYVILKQKDQHIDSSVTNLSSGSCSQTNTACGSPTRESHIERSTEDVTAMMEEPGSPLSDVSIHSDAADSPEEQKIKNTLRKKMKKLNECEEVLKMRYEEASILEKQYKELLADIKYLQNKFRKKCKSLKFN